VADGYADAPTLRVENPWEYSDGTGVDISTNRATGLRVASQTGTALSVEGPATFSRSGVATIPAGRATWTSEEVGIGAFSFVLATLQADVGDVVLRAAVPHPDRGSLTLRLSGPRRIGRPRGLARPELRGSGRVLLHRPRG
jgi:hypothetical protein